MLQFSSCNRDLPSIVIPSDIFKPSTAGILSAHIRAMHCLPDNIQLLYGAFVPNRVCHTAITSPLALPHTTSNSAVMATSGGAICSKTSKAHYIAKNILDSTAVMNTAKDAPPPPRDSPTQDTANTAPTRCWTGEGPQDHPSPFQTGPTTCRPAQPQHC